ncbi:hypothetical protein HYC85_031992 [Camellia sinensis]|uniref:Protein kinase domain-containing protein n=1 Tax=Camellia sinensis TaxID=4442 RepID=A0A7J7FS75_CAMSI|nr:hypothetical protein HYC85_031992 [Camellia sinensis]
MSKQFLKLMLVTNMALESCEGGELFDQITRSQDSRHDSIKDSQITILPNASSDDKACTFVGTAAYVPREVLNSSPATFGYIIIILVKMIDDLMKLKRAVDEVWFEQKSKDH